MFLTGQWIRLHSIQGKKFQNIPCQHQCSLERTSSKNSCLQCLCPQGELSVSLQPHLSDVVASSKGRAAVSHWAAEESPCKQVPSGHRYAVPFQDYPSLLPVAPQMPPRYAGIWIFSTRLVSLSMQVGRPHFPAQDPQRPQSSCCKCQR